MKTLGIIGAGDLGKQIAYYAINDHHYDNVVFFDDYYENTPNDKIKLLGKLLDIEKAFNNNLFDELIIGIGYNHLEFKNKIYKTYVFQCPRAAVDVVQLADLQCAFRAQAGNSPL